MQYVENYSPVGPLQPISEESAKQRGMYSVEITDNGPRHFQDVFEHALERVIYPETLPSSALVMQHCQRYPAVPFWVISPIAYAESEPNYTVWYYHGDGTLEKRVEYENSPMLSRRTWFHPDGRLGGSTERRFDEAGEQIDVTYRDADSKSSVIDD
jgi:hypothetical protein